MWNEGAEKAYCFFFYFLLCLILRRRLKAGSSSSSSSSNNSNSRVGAAIPASSVPTSQAQRIARTVCCPADQAAAALTDSQYIEKLQTALQQASVSSLQERLAERKNHSLQLVSASCCTSPAVRFDYVSFTGDKRYQFQRSPTQNGCCWAAE